METTRIANFLMKTWENFPTSPESTVGESNEIFRPTIFLNGSETERKTIMLKSSENKYKSELGYPWDHYFGVDLSTFLRGKVALDLGCFTGGRGIAWVEKYKLDYLIGIDVKQTYIDAAMQFASMKKIQADFKVGRAEMLPFKDETFDAILSFDVFEHVQDVKLTLNECYRVLKTNGRLFLVFPGYFHPTGHHLSRVTRLPCIHYLFRGETLIKAYYKILEERGSEAYWYKRHSPYLESWERGNEINGTTLAQFRRFLIENNWKVVLHSKKPIGSIGRNVSKKRAPQIISYLFHPLIFIPGLQEIFLHRITYILEKGNS